MLLKLGDEEFYPIGIIVLCSLLLPPLGGLVLAIANVAKSDQPWDEVGTYWCEAAIYLVLGVLWAHYSFLAGMVLEVFKPAMTLLWLLIFLHVIISQRNFLVIRASRVVSTTNIHAWSWKKIVSALMYAICANIVFGILFFIGITFTTKA